MSFNTNSIVGRYAPSPTGELHLGNLRSALLAWLHARLQGGTFVLRMEDLDTPRVIAGSDSQILTDLAWLGLDWDGPVIYQSQRQQRYQDALDALIRQQLIYPCFCSRKELREIASAPHGGTPIYPGLCADLSKDDVTRRNKQKTPALRVRVADKTIEFIDAVQGRFQQHLKKQVGDFVIKRADGLFAYQLAVVVDDLEQGVTDIMRGADLIDSTPRQLFLAQCLNPERQAFHYWHVPLVTDEQGQRMAKRDGSNSIREWQAQSRSAEQMVGQFAWQLGMIDQPQALSAMALKQHLNVETFRLALVAYANQPQVQPD